MTAGNESRRDFVKRATYVTPAVLTLVAAPEFAKAGSVKVIDIGKGRDGGLGKDLDIGKAPGKKGGPGKTGGHDHGGGSAGHRQRLRKETMADAGSRRASAHSSRMSRGDAPSLSSSSCGRSVDSMDCAGPQLKGKGSS